MTKEELKERTKKFAFVNIKLVDEFPNAKAVRTISKQIIRSGTSVAANYRAACGGRSNADFISKSHSSLGIWDLFSSAFPNFKTIEPKFKIRTSIRNHKSEFRNHHDCGIISLT